MGVGTVLCLFVPKLVKVCGLFTWYPSLHCVFLMFGIYTDTQHVWFVQAKLHLFCAIPNCHICGNDSIAHVVVVVVELPLRLLFPSSFSSSCVHVLPISSKILCFVFLHGRCCRMRTRPMYLWHLCHVITAAPTAPCTLNTITKT